jgi:hypothetical protein
MCPSPKKKQPKSKSPAKGNKPRRRVQKSNEEGEPDHGSEEVLGETEQCRAVFPYVNPFRSTKQS